MGAKKSPQRRREVQLDRIEECAEMWAQAGGRRENFEFDTVDGTGLPITIEVHMKVRDR